MIRQLAKGLPTESSSGWKANPLLVVAKVGPSLRFHLTQTGGYAIWGHALAWDDNSDSFWVTWQRADPNEDAHKRQKYQFRWAVAGGAVWHWDRINAWLDGGKPEREWEFKQPSETTLRIAVRDATMLDTLFITSNVKAKDPSAANVRLFQLRKTGRFRLKS